MSSSNFEILCVTMRQKDFSKIKEMNIHSDVVFANQDDRVAYDELEFEGHTAKMISTNTRGCGINRNLALAYASGEICLFADDDVTYIDDMEKTVLGEFDAHPDADVIIFHIEADDPSRPQRRYKRTHKHRFFERKPWGAIRVAFRLRASRKANLWFNMLFGGGSLFSNGEDSKWIREAKRKGLVFYVSNKTIGITSVANSSWYTGHNEKYYYNRGVYYQSEFPRTFCLWTAYFIWRTWNHRELSLSQKIRWMRNGRMGYQELISYDQFLEKYQKTKREVDKCNVSL